MELFVTIPAKHSILDVWQGSEYVSAFCLQLQTHPPSLVHFWSLIGTSQNSPKWTYVLNDYMVVMKVYLPSLPILKKINEKRDF